MEFLFWPVMLLPPAILFFFFSWLMIPYFVAGCFALVIYIREFKGDVKIDSILGAFFLPHLYFFLRLIFKNGSVL